MSPGNDGVPGTIVRRVVGRLLLHLRETGAERAYSLSLARSRYQRYLASIGLAYLGSGIVRTIPPITSCGLKSLFGLFGCAL